MYKYLIDGNSHDELDERSCPYAELLDFCQVEAAAIRSTALVSDVYGPCRWNVGAVHLSAC